MPVNIVIDTVLAQDWEALRDLRISMLADSPGAYKGSLALAIGLTEEGWRDAASGNSLFILARDEESGDTVGGASIQPIPPDATGATFSHALVTSVFVQPRWRGHGIVERLFDALDTLAAGLGRSVMRLEVSSASQHAAEKFSSLGFEPTGRSRVMPRDHSLTLIEYERAVYGRAQGFRHE